VQLGDRASVLQRATMEKDRASLDEIVRTLVDLHGCHAVILYGSRARGDFEPTSDWDVAGIRKTGESQRVARDLHGAWLDAFVHPESHFAKLDADSLRFLGGRIVVDREGFAKTLLDRVAAFEKKGPPPLPRDEEEVLRVWYSKMLARIARPDLEAKYRRAWLLFQALEDYFKLRNRWYRGPKESFPWLAKNDPETHGAFTRALEPEATMEDLRVLVTRVLATTDA
jgi:uncharacterized protein